MIRSLIIDDEPDARETLILAVKKFCPDVEVQAACETPEKGLKEILNLQPDLIFLDVEMPGMSGFDLLQQLDDINFAVIFVTAYNRYAIQAIKFSALDYLLKPVDPDDLVSAVRKAIDWQHQKELTFRYQSVLSNAKSQQLNMNKLAIPDSEGIIFVETAHIICCRADGNYTMLYMSGGKTILVSKPLKDFETILSNHGFSRVHHAALINMNHVQKYVRGDGGYVIMSDNHHVDVSRRKKEAFLRQFNKI